MRFQPVLEDAMFRSCPRTLSVTAAALLCAQSVSADTLPRGTWVPDGLLANLQDSALNIVATELETTLDQELRDGLYAIDNAQIYDEGCFWQYTAYIDHVSFVDFDTPEITLDSRAGSLHADFVVTNLRIEFVLDGEGLFCSDYYDCDSAVDVDLISGTGDAAFTVSNGHVVTQMIASDATVSGYEYDTSWDCFIIELIAEILQDSIEEELEASLLESIQTDLPASLDDLFAGLEFAESSDLFDVPYFMEGRPRLVLAEDAGITLDEESRLSGESAPCGPMVNEFRYTPGAMPTFAGGVPGTGEPYDMAVALSDDIFNQLLYTTYDTGALCITLDADSEERYGVAWDYTTTDLMLFFPELYELAPDAPTMVQIVPRAAPEVTIGEGDGFVEGQLDIILNETEVSLFVEIEGVWEKALTLAVTADGEFLVRVTEAGSLRVWMSDLFDIGITIEDEPLVDLNDLVIEELVPRLLSVVVPIMFASLDGIWLPHVGDYAMLPVAVLADGPAADFLSIYVLLVAP
jgi:hypothetical protein